MRIRSLIRHLLCVALVGLSAPCASAQQFAERRALVIGIDNYFSSDVPALRFAQRDAEQVAARLNEQGYKVTRLLGPEATRDAVVGHLVLAQEQLRPDDSFVLYYAGHGLIRDVNGEVYWLNYDGDPRRPDIHGLRARYVVDLVREIGARRKLILLDHCYAGSTGSASSPGSVVATPADGTGAAGSATREAFPHEFTRQMDRALLESTDRARMVFVVAGSRGPSFEIDTLQHGIFSHVLLRALRDVSADTDKVDGALSIGELTRFLKTTVKTLAQEKGLHQVPYAPAPPGFDLGDRDDGGEWQFFLRALTAAEIEARAPDYDDRVRRWTNKQYISPETLTRFEGLLDRWKNSSVAGLGEGDARAVAAMRILIDTPSVTLDEPAVARLFQEQLTLWGDDP